MRTGTSPTTSRPSRLIADLQLIADRAARHRRDLPAPQILLRARGVEFASGDRDRALHPASAGKIMTATLAMQHAERGALDLDAPLPRVLRRSDWNGLFVRDDVDLATSVTTRHLMQHTSGVADYFEGRSSAPESFLQQVTRDRDHRWTPAELLNYTRRWQRPVGIPGQRFEYSDTGYVLLARVIEEAGGATLGAQLHERILGPAGMDRSCLMFYTSPGGGPSPTHPGAAFDIAPMIIGRADLSRAESLSCDYGGGSVVTTLDDLLRFDDAWRGGALVGPESIAFMADTHSRFRPGIHYGAGLMQLRYGGLSPLLAGMPPMTGHLGVTGVHLFTGGGVQLVMNFHGTREMRRSFATHVSLVRRARRALR